MYLRAVWEGERDDPCGGTATLDNDLIERLQKVSITGISRDFHT